jgi:hypothetical protein
MTGKSDSALPSMRGAVWEWKAEQSTEKPGVPAKEKVSPSVEKEPKVGTAVPAVEKPGSSVVSDEKAQKADGGPTAVELRPDRQRHLKLAKEFESVQINLDYFGAVKV